MEEIKYYHEDDKAVLDKVTEIAEELGFSVDIYNNDDNEEYNIRFGKYTDCGQDFSFEIDVTSEDNLTSIWRKIDEYYESYDVSYEAYLWLDSSGHGTNGAPYEMIDVYNDMKQCEGFIEELANKILNVNIL